MRTCPSCGEAVEDATARFCGHCGALLHVAGDSGLGADDPLDAGDGGVGGDRGAGDRGRQPARLLVVVGLITVAVVALVGQQRAPDPAATATEVADDELVGVPVAPPSRDEVDSIGTGRVFAREGSVVWEVEVAAAELATDVRAAGPDRVLVGDRIVATTPTASTGLFALPDAIARGVLGPDGRWAVAEGGSIVLGSLEASDAGASTLSDGRTLAGPAVAWVDGDPVISGEDGRLARVTAVGAVVWEQDVVVTGAWARGGWLAGEDGDGDPVAVALGDGSVVPLDAPALAVHGDVVVLPLDDIVGLDLQTGAEVWRRADEAGRWTAVGDHLVQTAAGVAVRVDPRSGEEQGRVTGFVPAATDERVVVQVQGRLRASDWQGEPAWERVLDPQATHVVRTIDADRIAVRSEDDDGVRVTVLTARDGTTLTAFRAPTVLGRSLVASGDSIVVLDGDESVAAVEDGQAVSAPDQVTAAAADLLFGTGAREVQVTAGVAGLVGIGTSSGWALRPAAPIVAGPIRSGTSVVVGLADGTVLSVAPGDGDVRWETDLGVLPTALGSDGTQLLVGTADGRVLRLDPDGAVVTTVQTDGGPVLAVLPGRPAAAALLADRVLGIDLDG